LPEAEVSDPTRNLDVAFEISEVHRIDGLAAYVKGESKPVGQ
jgi:hypothetical protein